MSNPTEVPPPEDPGPSESDAPHRKLKLPRFRYVILIWLLLIMIINYMDRASVSIAAPKMIEELGLTRTDIGLLGAVFSWTYGIFQLPSGYLIDKVGAKRMYYLALGFWSIATALMSVGRNMTQFVAFRVLLGIGESPNSPNCSKIATAWFPRSERGQAAGIWDSGSKWGAALAPPILTALMLAFGWRAMFIGVGALGIVLAAAFLAFYREPEESKRLSEEEYKYILTGRDDPKETPPKLPWLKFFTYPQTWGMMLGFFTSIWIWNIFLTFLPLYLEDALGVSIAAAGLLAALPFLAAGAGEVLGGRLTLLLVRHYGFTPMHSKKTAIIGAALITGVMLAITPFMPNLVWAEVVLCVALGLIAVLQGQSWALTTDIVPDSHAARFGSMMNFGGYFGGAASPLLTGLIYDQWHSYAPSFWIAAGIAFCGAGFYGFMVRKPISSVRYDMPDAARTRKGN